MFNDTGGNSLTKNGPFFLGLMNIIHIHSNEREWRFLKKVTTEIMAKA